MMNMEPTPYDLTMAAAYAAEYEAYQQEAFYAYADEEFGPDWENNSADPEFRRFVPESEVEMVTDEDRAALAQMLDVEAFHF